MTSSAERRRVAVVVPPENPTVEDELTTTLAEDVAFHVARFTLTPGADPLSQVRECASQAPGMIDAFGNLPVDAFWLACTAMSYMWGPVHDAELCASLSSAAGAPVATATAAMAHVLGKRGVEAFTLVSPYPDWLNEKAIAYWEDSGFRVDACLPVQASAGPPPYGVVASDVVAAVGGAGHRPGTTTLLCSGTGMATLRAGAQIELEQGCTVLSSNLCGAIWLMESADRTERAA